MQRLHVKTGGPACTCMAVCSLLPHVRIVCSFVLLSIICSPPKSALGAGHMLTCCCVEPDLEVDGFHGPGIRKTRKRTRALTHTQAPTCPHSHAYTQTHPGSHAHICIHTCLHACSEASGPLCLTRDGALLAQELGVKEQYMRAHAFKRSCVPHHISNSHTAFQTVTPHSNNQTWHTAIKKSHHIQTVSPHFKRSHHI